MNDNLNIILREHQKNIIKKMLEFEKSEIKIETGKLKKKIGILADRVGSGKSFDIIGMILQNVRAPIQEQFFYNNNDYFKISLPDLKTINTNLIIVPDTLLNQWEGYLKEVNQTETIKVYVMREPNTSINIQNYTIVCTSPKYYININKEYVYDRIFIDEADTIKLKDFNLFYNFLWLVTGTPKGLLGTRNAFGKIFPSNSFSYMNYFIIKNDDEYIKKSLEIPPAHKKIIYCKTPYEIEILQGIIPDGVLNLINAGNIKEAMRRLDCNSETEESFVKKLTNRIQNLIKQRETEIRKLDPTKEVNQKKINTYKRTIKRLKERLDSIMEKIENLEEEVCPICMGEINNPTMLNCCKSVYCFDCITIMLKVKKKCPHCNSTNISSNNLCILKKNEEIEKEKIKYQEKIDTLATIIESGGDDNYLVFANYPETLKIIEKKLNKNKITFDYLSESNHKFHTKIIKSFEEKKTKVLLLNAKNFGAGLNLHMANNIVIYHRFTQELEEQIIGRALRMGQKNMINIYYLLHSNENQTTTENFEFTDFDMTEETEEIEEVEEEEVEEVEEVEKAS